jgi:sulfur carrier protein ThiS
MKVLVKLIGPLIYAAGFSEKEIDAPEEATVGSILAALDLPKDRPRIVTRNGRAVTPAEVLAEGDRLVVSPLYSGG